MVTRKKLDELELRDDANEVGWKIVESLEGPGCDYAVFDLFDMLRAAQMIELWTCEDFNASCAAR